MNGQALLSLTDKYDIYFEGSLISKEYIIKKYAEFLVSSIFGEVHSASIALHTGSVCFEIISLIMTVLACVSLNETEAESIIASLTEGDMVLYENGRYRWCGIRYMNEKKCIVLEKDGSGKNGEITVWAPYDLNKNQIKPYYGTSDVTDGRGIRRRNTNRAEFISQILGVAKTDVPSVIGVSAVIVTERDIFDRLSKALRVVYGHGKSIGLLDIVTASYYSDTGEEYQYGNNPSKTEPVLKVTGKISTARDLILDKHGNKTVGLTVISEGAASKGRSELADLLGRKSLKFAHVAVGIDSECAENIIEVHEDIAIFACTKEFLLQNSLPPQVSNTLTIELEKQIKNVISNVVTTVVVNGSCSWEDMCKTREALYIIRKSECEERVKSNFIIIAYSLLNLFTTAVFPIETLEKAVKDGRLMAGITSPSLRLRELRELADKTKSLDHKFAYVVDVLERMYQSCFSGCPKHNVLKQLLNSSVGRKTAIVVPKAYYIDILSEDETLKKKGVTIVTGNRFNNSVLFDKVIVVGNFSGKQFNPLKYKAAADINVLLYENEMHLFSHKIRKAEKFAYKLNYKLGVLRDDVLDTDLAYIGSEDNNLITLTEEELDLEEYIERINTLDIAKIAAKVSSSSGNTLTSEVGAVGRFTSGQQILLSKYYNAVVFDSIKGNVTETNVEDLSAGDQLVFAKRDDYTRNMVDYIYENLQTSGRLNAEIMDATEKAAYWKQALREYKQEHGFSYRDISKGLQKLGSSLQEVSVRQWLIEESHIVGPRDEITMKQIAELIQDSYLLGDTHSYFESCRIVRRQRKEILELIGKAITDKLSGNKPPVGSILEIVYDNVENLSETLELEVISLLEEPVIVPINLVNKPILDWEGIE